MKKSRVRVFNPKGEGWMGTQYEIDGKKIDGVMSVDFHVAVDEIPQFIFEMIGEPDIEMVGDIQFQFTPQTVQEAAAVIRKEFCYSSDCFKAMAASVEERLRMHIADQTDAFRKALAEDITKQILGI